MFEATIFLFVAVIAAWCVWSSFFRSNVIEQDYLKSLKIPEDSTLRRHFITHLKSEIEATLYLCPNDSVLQRRYNTLVAVELNQL